MKYFVPLAIVSVGCLCYWLTSTDVKGFLSSASNSDRSAEHGVDSSLASPSPRSGEGHIEIDSDSKLVLMKFGASWCPPCRMVDKELRTLGGMDLPVEIRKIDVDERPGLASQYEVRSIPRLILLQDGRKIGDLVGYRSADQLTDWIEESASSEALAAKKRESDPTGVHANPFFE